MFIYFYFVFVCRNKKNCNYEYNGLRNKMSDSSKYKKIDEYNNYLLKANKDCL